MTEQEQLPIVVGIDGFETGRRALDWALREAQARHCAVQVVHAWVFDPAADYFTETSSQLLHQESVALLRREVEQATSGMTDIPPITQNSVEGDPTRVLPELARGAAMLVVGRHRGGLLRQALLGSVSAVCVRHATCPVVVIPAAVPQPAETRRSWGSPTHGLGKA
ncbi:MAG TPA: universal stress protein [Pseudonocardiaceae bacterium]|jgi:nucleotide-binding universal stress UspA family protein|nr:universal stress protein [Pseudonocardiaceae bacterium]